MSDPVSSANALNDATITTNGQRQITGASLHAVIAAVIGLVAGVGGAAIMGTAGSNMLPSTNASICLPQGASVTLPAGASPNVTETVADCTPGADANPQLLVTPSTVLASSDATIMGAPSYALTITGQSVGFRKTAAGVWKPF